MRDSKFPLVAVGKLFEFVVPQATSNWYSSGRSLANSASDVRPRNSDRSPLDKFSDRETIEWACGEVDAAPRSCQRTPSSGQDDARPALDGVRDRAQRRTVTSHLSGRTMGCGLMWSVGS